MPGGSGVRSTMLEDRDGLGSILHDFENLKKGI